MRQSINLTILVIAVAGAILFVLVTYIPPNIDNSAVPQRVQAAIELQAKWFEAVTLEPEIGVATVRFHATIQWDDTTVQDAGHLLYLITLQGWTVVILPDSNGFTLGGGDGIITEKIAHRMSLGY